MAAPVKTVAGKIRPRKIDDLKPHPDNVRVHTDEQVDMLVKSFKEFGFVVPVLVDEKDTILSGHGRVAAALKMGLKTVPTIDAKHLTEAQKKAFLIADNALVERGGWDDSALSQLVLELDTMKFDLDVIGVEPDKLHVMLEDARTSFLEPGEKPPRGRSRDATTISEFVQLNFTLSPEGRKTVMDVLKREQQERGLATSGEALVAMCQEIVNDA